MICRYDDCEVEFTQFSSLQKFCREHAYQTAKKSVKQRTPIKRSQKRIPQKGRGGKQYDKWRDLVARPHLDRRDGLLCNNCKAPPPTDETTGVEGRHQVAHIIGRGRDSSKKMDVDNVRYLCGDCHDRETKGETLSG